MKKQMTIGKEFKDFRILEIDRCLNSLTLTFEEAGGKTGQQASPVMFPKSKPLKRNIGSDVGFIHLIHSLWILQQAIFTTDTDAAGFDAWLQILREPTEEIWSENGNSNVAFEFYQDRKPCSHIGQDVPGSSSFVDVSSFQKWEFKHPLIFIRPYYLYPIYVDAYANEAGVMAITFCVHALFEVVEVSAKELEMLLLHYTEAPELIERQS
jgi:hypothetical protein